MNKTVWARPNACIDEFAANEYVAACYTAKCDISGAVYEDTNGNGQYDEGVDRYKYRNTACNTQYDITGQDSAPSYNAFIVKKGWKWVEGDSFLGGHYEEVVESATPVYNFQDIHASSSVSQHSRPNHS